MIRSIAFIALFISSSSFAQSNTGTRDADLGVDDPIVRDINWLNTKYLDKQRKIIDDMARITFGQQLRGNIDDLRLLQKIVDQELIAADEKEQLQALGVVLGDTFANSHRKLDWMVYQDKIGSSHAICLQNSSNCLFPVTMLSRRMEIGLKPNVQSVYDKALAKMKPYLPHVPYSN
jgi:hypothetical protein